MTVPPSSFQTLLLEVARKILGPGEDPTVPGRGFGNAW